MIEGCIQLNHRGARVVYNPQVPTELEARIRLGAVYRYHGERSVTHVFRPEVYRAWASGAPVVDVPAICGGVRVYNYHPRLIDLHALKDYRICRNCLRCL